ncbi:hypothetical protein Pmar_PMAR003706 [Perkinsus marinus ATCC 50983]|uniref:Uncharacterized protein n=1 Tax=Perkinsus marinus (strain ATCC 50983 / TXsc) TaxID=423536 RepID=C5KI31_PERM5|nr:hypothetical protein Pmar_PMAR003706 [Perkinsus marinus ATCC 50983]EER16243.1 hypothetical protein Pmar_PMAR003706 [Perkinsus marinus ATCC 50983]|eukprot:XP_002784447.1 hypothetical protein Pmar_PMAR003706 [Perkinsus marinus ATCC 50983]
MDFTSTHTLQLLFDTRGGLKGSRLGHGNDDPTIDRTSKYSAVDDLMDDAEMYTYEELMLLSPRQAQKYYDETDMVVDRMGRLRSQAPAGLSKELDSPGMPRTRTMATLAMQKGNREYVGPQMELIQAESKNDQPQVVPFKPRVAPGETSTLFPRRPLFRPRLPEPAESSDEEVYDFQEVDHYAARKARHMREIERLGVAGMDAGVIGFGGDVSPTASALTGGARDVVEIDVYVPPFDSKRVCKVRVPLDMKVEELETLILNEHTDEFGLRPLEHSYHLRWIDDDEAGSVSSNHRAVVEPDMDLPALDSYRAVGALNTRELCFCYSDWGEDSDDSDGFEGSESSASMSRGEGETQSVESSAMQRSIARSSAARASVSGVSSQAPTGRPHATQQRMPLTDVIGLLARKQQVDPDELERYYTLLVCKEDASQGYYEPVTDTPVSRLQSDDLLLRRKVG